MRDDGGILDVLYGYHIAIGVMTEEWIGSLRLSHCKLRDDGEMD